MPRLETTQTVQATHEVKLAPKVRARLLIELKAYQALKDLLKETQAEMDKHAAQVKKIREGLGENSLGVEGFKVTEVRGHSHKLNLKKLVAFGCATAWITDATETKPKKPYDKITCPGDRERSEDVEA